MGWKPIAVTHSSDHFPRLFEFAQQLIREGKAYVCHQSKEQVLLVKQLEWQ
jgi:glutaminyl-tRNA synthetase